ncbi:hypothetical protein HYDPIDRAFT_172917 [Hydnomerulius pinastri MD-312]|nr:hypothetical protein HYDPIDRAFT_172917 [Hydnomerulius pinastri MD-312]
MGAGQSKPETQPKVFYTETPIEFSQDVVNHLSDSLASPETTPERQSTLDAHIRYRIQNELQALRAEEENVQREIQRALEKENIDREIGGIGDTNAHGDVKNSAALIGDLEEIRAKVDRYQTRRQLSDFPFVREAGEAVASCYRSNATTPLDCWREVAQFKAAVTDAETQYLTSLR